jgi:citrate synthase
MSDFKPGLEGVVAFETQIAEPDREGGALRYRGVDIEDLVGQVSYGHVWGLLVDNAFRCVPVTSGWMCRAHWRCWPRPRACGRCWT